MPAYLMPGHMTEKHSSEPVLETFTIYGRPADMPQVPYVVRLWEVHRGTDPVPTGICWTAQTLRLARMWIPPGMVCLARSPEDDPTIVESWI